MPDAGRLDRRATIEQLTVVIDEFGQPIETWGEFATLWVGKRDIRANERFRAQQDLASETVTFIARWRDGVHAGMRLVAEGKTYDIEAVAELGRHAGLEIVGTAVRV